MKAIKTSLFAKYIFAFMTIIVLSFVLILTIIISMVNNYTTSLNIDTLSRPANSISSYIVNTYELYEIEDFDGFLIENGDEISPMLASIVQTYDNLAVFLTDSEGIILTATTGAAQYPANIQDGSGLPDSMMNNINEEKSGVSGLSTLDGTFSEEQFIYISPIRCEGTLCGTVVVCSTSDSNAELLQNMVKMIMIAIICILFAALIVFYFITERVIDPLREMSKASKRFAVGKFDVKVPVVGNDEVAELAEAFNHMAASLENLEKMRNSFVANISHDLKTPMTTIAGFIDNILVGAIPYEKQSYYLEIIKSEIKRLSRLVHSLLDISRIQAGDRKFTMVAFDVCEMARQILISFEQKISAKKLDVEFYCDNDNIIALADKDAIHQILYNICDNAIKFSRELGKLKISINFVDEKKKKIVVKTYNEGVGIAEEDIPFIFERFYKGDKSRGLDKTGVGLGMYISKTIIDAHSEEIWVDSKYGEYCEFAFTLTTAR